MMLACVNKRFCLAMGFGTTHSTRWTRIANSRPDPVSVRFMHSYQMKNTWLNEILKRFPDREDLGKSGLYDRYFRAKGLPLDSVLECLNRRGTFEVV